MSTKVVTVTKKTTVSRFFEKPAGKAFHQLSSKPAAALKSKNKTVKIRKANSLKDGLPIVPVSQGDDVKDLSVCKLHYPTDPVQRRTFKTKEGKAVTNHQWQVYDHIRRIPVGKVTTYKDIADALGSGSPRSVGSALRNNPFAPFAPCHRIVASNFYIGGFCGEYHDPKKLKAENLIDGQVGKKIRMLAHEGVGVDKKGKVVGGEGVLWR